MTARFAAASATLPEAPLLKASRGARWRKRVLKAALIFALLVALLGDDILVGALRDHVHSTELVEGKIRAQSHCGRSVLQPVHAAIARERHRTQRRGSTACEPRL